MANPAAVHVSTADKNKDAPSFYFSVRFLVAVMGCLALAIQYSQRVNLTMGIVCMVNKTAIGILQQKQRLLQQPNNTTQHFTTALLTSTAPSLHNNSVTTTEASSITTTPTTAVTTPNNANTRKKKKFKDGPFVWTRPVQGRVLSAYFFGYIAFQVGGAVFSQKFGPFIVLLSAMMFGTIMTFLTAPLAKYSYAIVIVLRILVGLSAGMVWPAIVDLCTRWSPAEDKSSILSIGNSGAQIGPLFSMPLYGALCASTVLGGWQLVFYVSGALGIAWCIACLLLVTSDPQKHRFISKREKQYIKETGIVDLSSKTDQSSRLSFLQMLPKVFTCVPCLAMFSCHFFKAFGFYTILTNISTYNEEILHLDLKSSGYLTAIPYVFYWIFTVSSGRVADMLMKKYEGRSDVVRKTFTGLGSFGPALTVFCLGFIDHRRAWLGIALITLTMSFLGCIQGGGMYIVCQDMAPRYAAVIWGISNTFGTAPGIIVPLVIGSITKNQLLKEWRIVFTICALSYIISGLAFIIWGSSEEQAWAKELPPPKKGKKSSRHTNPKVGDAEEMRTMLPKTSQ